MPPAEATLLNQVTTLTDRNSTAQIDDGSQMGLFTWTVDGYDQVFQQWFWYRVGSSGPENPVNALNLTARKVTDANFNAGDDHLVLEYTDPALRFVIQMSFDLSGGVANGRQSDIKEGIQILNTTASSLEFHFFQYTDFDLANTPGDDAVRIENGNLAFQTDSGPTAVSETGVMPPPDHYEVGLYDPQHLNGTLDKLNDGLPTTLNDYAGAVYGDVTWAFEWDMTLAPLNGMGNDRMISKDLIMTHAPEPLTMLGIVMGVGSVGAYIFRRRKTL
jgi:hypothetical protein